jgi:hypothetical protein
MSSTVCPTGAPRGPRRGRDAHSELELLGLLAVGGHHAHPDAHLGELLADGDERGDALEHLTWSRVGA